MSEIQYAYRLVPCPSYDVEGMESWLTDMASEGLFLSADGFFGHLGIFEKHPPHPCKYRLEAAPPKRAFEDSIPDTEALALSEELGWTYVARRGEFYIYCSEDTSARELNTDPAVQALALNQVIRRMRSTAFWTAMEIIFWFWYYTRGVLFLTMIELGVVYSLFILTLILLSGVKSVLSLVHLIRLRKKLQMDGFMDHRKNWRQRSAVYRSSNLMLIVAVITAVIIGMGKFGDIILDEGYIPLSDYTATPPFPTMKNVMQDARYEEEDFIIPNEVREWKTLITPRNIDWQEYAVLYLPDGREINGALEVYYHEAASPWIARRIAEEYLIHHRHKAGKNFSVLSADADTLGVDYAAAYSGRLHAPCVILQKENKVMWIQFYSLGEKSLHMEEWITVFAQSLY